MLCTIGDEQATYDCTCIMPQVELPAARRSQGIECERPPWR